MTSKRLILSWRAFWQARQARERAALAVLAVFLGVSAIVASGLGAHQAGARLERRLQRLESEVAAMRADAEQVEALRRAGHKNPPTGPALRELVARSAGEAGLDDLARSARGEGPERVRLEAEAPFSRFVAWQAALQAEFALRVEQLQATPTGVPDRVHLIVTLAHPDA